MTSAKDWCESTKNGRVTANVIAAIQQDAIAYLLMALKEITEHGDRGSRARATAAIQQGAIATDAGSDTITITIRTGSAAFDPEPGPEVARILHNLAWGFAQGGFSIPLRDHNSNAVGTVEVRNESVT